MNRLALVSLLALAPGCGGPAEEAPGLDASRPWDAAGLADAGQPTDAGPFNLSDAGAKDGGQGAVDSGHCADSCTLDAKKCEGNGVRTCQTTTSSCADWSSPVACKTWETCTTGICVAPACMPEDAPCAQDSDCCATDITCEYDALVCDRHVCRCSPCKLNGAHCAGDDSACCSGTCDSNFGYCCEGRTWPCGADTDCCYGLSCVNGSCDYSSTNCFNDGTFCTSSNECCSGKCLYTCQPCTGQGEDCVSSDDCCSGLSCSDDHCAACVSAGGSCGASASCCSGLSCIGSVCIASTCKSSGESCTDTYQCCGTLTCQGNVCTSATCKSLGEACTPGSVYGTSDCCSGLDCDTVQKICCYAPGKNCTTGSDCCYPVCNLSTGKCQ